MLNKQYSSACNALDAIIIPAPVSVASETNNIQKYHYMWEELRDHRIYTDKHMKIKNVIMGIEEAYKRFEEDTFNN